VSTNSEGNLLWVSPQPTNSREVVEAAAHALKLTVHFCAYEELFDQLRLAQYRIVAIEFGGKPVDSLALLKQLRTRAPRAVSFAACADSSVGLIRAALIAGANDFLSLPLQRQELDKALIKLTQAGLERRAGGINGEVITICGARGGLGATTLAVNLAVRLAGRTGAKVALVDLDLQRGDVAAFLNLAPVQSLSAMTTTRGEIDELFLQDAMTRHPSGVFVLAAPALIEEADAVGHPEVEMGLNMLRSQFGYTVIDTARTITPATLAAFEGSDRILLLTDLSVPGVRAARRLVDLFGRLNIPIDRVEWLVTMATQGPVSLPDAVRTIGKSPFLTIPSDPALANELMNAGTPLNGTRGSALAVSIEALAGKLIGGEAAGKPARRGLFQRILTRRSRSEL
jgi:pilus assembly protein CpaE